MMARKRHEQPRLVAGRVGSQFDDGPREDDGQQDDEERRS
jgi:hypothetical protein